MGFMPLQRCCCWDNVRSGSIASAIYTIIVALFGIVGSSVEIFVSADVAQRENITFRRAEEHAVEVGSCIDLALTFILLINSVLLLIGICRNNKYLMLPYIVNLCILIPLQSFMVLLYFLFMFFAGPQNLLLNLIVLVVLVSFISLNLYCLLCVISHFQNLHAGREVMRAEYRQHGERLPEPDLPDSERFVVRSEPVAPLPGMDSSKGSGFAYQPVVQHNDEEEAPPPYIV